MSKRKNIQKAEAILSEYGLTSADYVISLQGPTVIFATSAYEKIKNILPIKADLMQLGISIL